MTEHHLDHPSLDGLNRLSASAEEVGETDEYGDVVPDGEADGDETSPTSAAKRHARGLLDWIVVIGIALLVAFVVRTFVLAHFVVDGESMMTTLHDGDRVFVNKLSYRLHDPNRGDVVVLHEMQTGVQERDLIKRVIALEGESLEIRNCEVFVDEDPNDAAPPKKLIEPYLDAQVVAGTSWCEFGPQLVPNDNVFVMGDNRPGSSDSRTLGPIPIHDIVGRAFVVFWPKAHWQWL
jgi:signal peptidase I